MTAPRQILAGTSYLVTRRCSQRQFLLRPSARTNEIVGYLLAVAARRFGIRVHAYCVLSNHFHIVLTDPRAMLPAFEQYLDSLIARAMNASLGRWESFWAPSSYSAVALPTPADIVEKAAYVLANPVAAGLVRHGRDWPGLRSCPEWIGGSTLTMRRPTGFFRSNGSMPERAALRLEAPPGFDSNAFVRALGDALEHHEERARRALAAAGRGFLGIARVLAQNPFARPAPTEPRRKLAPRVASRDRWKRVETLSRIAAFIDRYREAWHARTAGDPSVVFPAGTYHLRVVHRVRCAAV